MNFDDKQKLINIAKKQPKKEFKKDETNELDDIRQYISDCNIKSFNEKIPAHLVYNRYRHWAKINNVPLRSSVNFFQKFSFFFNKKTTGGSKYYLLHPEGWDLTFESLRISREQYNNGRKAKKKR